MSTIVSLTTIPSRIDVVHLTIASILNGLLRPDKIVLWIDDSLEASITPELLEQAKDILEIKVCEDIRSYKKIIYSLIEYPNDIIVTADDDIQYPPVWLQSLHVAYRENPQYIHCHRAHYIPMFEDKTLASYNECLDSLTHSKPSQALFFTGVGGVLYPPHTLHEDVTKTKLFMKLAPFSDDIWLNAMAILKGTYINVVKNNLPDDQLPCIPGTQDIALCRTNIDPNALINNDTQIRAVYSHYNIYDILYKNLDKDFILEKFSMLVERHKVCKQSRWYRFGKFSKKRKLWVIAKVLSKKLHLYWLVLPIADRLLNLYRRNKI